MFTLNIATTNDAFADNPGYEVAEILRTIANRVEDTQPSNHTQSILDVNGNRVGSWKLTDDD